MRVTIALLLVAACGEDLPDPLARIEVITTLPFGDPTTVELAFDQDSSLVLADRFNGLQRLDGTTFRPIPGTDAFAFGSFGSDRDGSLLVTNNFNVAKLPPNNVLTPIGPGLPESCFAPIGTAAGNYYVRSSSETTSFMLAPGAVEWAVTPLQLANALHAGDGSLFAIIDGDLVRLDATDTATPISSCPELGGSCARHVLSGLDADGQIYMLDIGGRAIAIADPTGAIRELELPGGLLAESLEASTQMPLLVATDPARADERSLWLLPLGAAAFARVATLPITRESRLLADRAGAMYLVNGPELHRIVLQ
jgi:hypothetical protein